LFCPAFVYGAFTVGTGNSPKKIDPVKNIVFAPNPVSTNLHIQTIEVDNYIYEIYSTEGVVIQKGRIKNSNVDVSSLPTGAYIMTVFDSNRKIATGKFFKFQLK